MTSRRSWRPGRAGSILAAPWLRRLPWADLLNRDRILAWCGILLALEVLFLGFMVLWHHDAFFRIDPPTSTDFVSFYAAGKLALAGTPALAYDQAAHAAAEAAATAAGIEYRFFFYPPVYLLWCAPLALLPYLVAFVLFQAATLAAWLLVMRRILQVQGWAWCVPVLAFPAVFWTLGQGQNSFLTAALLGAMTLLLDARPAAAGVALGMLCYKPHLALLAPVALAAGGRWRTFAAAAATVAALVGLSVALFGVQTWRDYLTALAGSQAVYETGRINLAGFVTPYGAARVLGAGARHGAGAAGRGFHLVVVLVGWIWRRDPGPAVRSAALAAGILLSVPLALVYDLLLTTVAIGWLVRQGRSPGFWPGKNWRCSSATWCRWWRAISARWRISRSARWRRPRCWRCAWCARDARRPRQPEIWLWMRGSAVPCDAPVPVIDRRRRAGGRRRVFRVKPAGERRPGLNAGQ